MADGFDTSPLEGLTIPWPLPFEHVSASMLGQYLRCPEQFRQYRFLGRRMPPKGFLIWGTADHRALEVNWRQKIASHEDIPTSDVQEAFAEALDAEIREAGEVEWGADKPGDVKDAGVALVAAYHEKASPRVQPVQVEQKFSLEIPGVPVPIIGYIDLETEGPIVERKTSARKTSTVPGNYRLQASIYQLARRRSVDFHYSVKTKTPQIVLPDEAPGLTVPVSDAALLRAEDRVRRVVRSLVATFNEFGPDEPWPDAIFHDPCSWCGFRPVCPHWGN